MFIGVLPFTSRLWGVNNCNSFCSDLITEIGLLEGQTCNVASVSWKVVATVAI